MHIILTLSSAFALFVNGEVAYKIFRGKKSFVGPYIAHIGISIFLIGVIATGGQSQKKQIDLVKGETVNLFGHNITFKGIEPFENGKKYKMNIEVKNESSVRIISPVMFIADFNNSLMREPGILVGFTKDFYVEPVSYSEGDENEAGNSISIQKGETKDYNGVEITFNQFNFPTEVREAMMAGKDFQIGAKLSVKYNYKTREVEPMMKSVGGKQEHTPVELKDADLRIKLGSMDASGNVNLELSKISAANSSLEKPKEVLTVEASIKPFISLVWIGVLTVVAGFLISAFRRSKESLV
jgi:cytochrome c-type biogenesis protein CcmF